MTPVERHAELVYAESLYEKVCVLPPAAYTHVNTTSGRACLVSYTLGIGWPSSRKCEHSLALAPCGTATQLPKLSGILVYSLNMRTTFSIYRQLGRYLEAADAAYAAAHANNGAADGSLEDPSIDIHLRTGVYLGVGLSHLVLSLIPGPLLTIVELFGYRGDRKEALRMLNRAGGWDAHGRRSVIPQGRTCCIARACLGMADKSFRV